MGVIKVDHAYAVFSTHFINFLLTEAKASLEPCLPPKCWYYRYMLPPAEILANYTDIC